MAHSESKPLMSPACLGDIQRLHYFIVAAERGSFTEAAAEFRISQSAISQQIAELEKQVGFQLFIRSNRQCQVTTLGNFLLKEARALLAKTEEASSRLRAAIQGMVGYLRIGFMGSIEKGFLPETIREFCQQHPQIDLSLQQYTCTELNKALDNDEIDIGFTISYDPIHFPNLERKTLFRDNWCVAMHCDHPLADEKKINPARLYDTPFITFSPEADYITHSQTLQLCGKYGFTPQKTIFCRDVASILYLVESGLGLAILPGSIPAIAGHNLSIIEIEPHPTPVDIIVVWKKNYSNPTVSTWLATLEAPVIKPLRKLNAALAKTTQGFPA